MADTFNSSLKSELSNIDGQLESLGNRRRLIQELLDIDAPPVVEEKKPEPQRRAPRRASSAPAPVKRTRRPRGLITNKVREYLGDQSEPVHATEILSYLEKNDAAPQSAKPMPTLQSTLQRMKELGEIANRGRNRWALISKSGGSEAPEPAVEEPKPSAPAPVAAAPTPPAAVSPSPIQRPERPGGPPVVTSTTTFGSRPLSNQ